MSTNHGQFQRFEVTYSSKPNNRVRDTMKSMGFGWNKWEGCWELYTWQVRLYDVEEIAGFLSSLDRGVLLDAIPVPKAAKRQWWKDVDASAKGYIEQLAKETDAERHSESISLTSVWLITTGYREQSDLYFQV